LFGYENGKCLVLRVYCCGGCKWWRFGV